MIRLLARGGWLAVTLVLLATLVVAGGREPAPVDVTPAADLGQFSPGNIISDSIFFNGTAMDAGAIQAFLNVKGINCRAAADGTQCLKTYTQDTSARPADGLCNGYAAASREPAAVIIAKAATSCGINPQVLLVMLQKEQGLVLASGSGLTARRYQIAMGFACPDNGTCNPSYNGFQNQVYSAARQYKNYVNNPGSFGYRVGRTQNINFQVVGDDPGEFNYQARDCGSSPVYIQNRATAALYNYTPYQPNAAALGAGYGLGDRCSAYGNRNFWLYFTDWFGSTQVPGQSVWQPVGALGAPTAVDRVVRISGWAVDPDDVNAKATVHVYVDGRPVASTRADQYSADTGGYEGYSVRLPVAAGSRQICTYAINIGRGDNNTHLGCRTLTVGATLTNDPTGAVEASASGRTITVSGWTLDPNALTTALSVHVYVDGAGVAVLRAGDAGAPTGTVFPGAGDAHRYSAVLPSSPGRHEVCAYGINVGAGTNNTHLGCRTVLIDAAAFNPTGAWEVMEMRGTRLAVGGWARDLDATGPIQVHAYVDGAGSVLVAGGPHATANGYGFEGSLAITPGEHKVCLYAINVGPGSTNPHLGCRNVTVDAKAFDPVGALEPLTAVGATVTFSGWATDPDVPGQALQVHLYVDGRGQGSVVADQAHPTADGHGYRGTLVLPQGVHSVCTYAINVGLGRSNTHLGCRSVTVTANPVGALESVTAVGGTVTVSGWATDPDVPAQAVQVHVYANGRPQYAVTADRPNATAAGHGYGGTLSLPQGTHSVCAYAINVGPGTANTHLGCRSVTVSANPGGAQERVTAIGTTVTVSGWTIDPDAPAQALAVHVYANGRPQFAVRADQSHPTANGHGFTGTLTLAPGTHSVCTWAINVGAGSSNTQLGCTTVRVSANDPSGALDSVTASAGTVTATGWAVDPDLPGQTLQVHVYADGVARMAVTANQPGGAVDGRAYSAALSLPPGPHTVCTYAINVGAGTSNTHLGCRQVRVG